MFLVILPIWILKYTLDGHFASGLIQVSFIISFPLKSPHQRSQLCLMQFKVEKQIKIDLPQIEEEEGIQEPDSNIDEMNI